jgi:hypothetical protein
MKRRNCLRLATGVVALGLCFLPGLPALAGPMEITVSPNAPTTSTPITLGGWAEFGDTGQDLLDTAYVLAGNRIDLTVTIQDLHSPGSVHAQVMTREGGTVGIGLLPVGTYDVFGTMWVVPWFAGSPSLMYSGNSSFQVAPEPGTLALMGLGSLVGLRRKPR